LIGGDDVVPHFRLPNPADDDDAEILTDNPYGTAPNGSCFVPSLPIGRIVDGYGGNMSMLLRQLDNLVEARREAWRLEESLWAAGPRQDPNVAGTLALVREQKERVRDLLDRRKQLGFPVPDGCETWWSEYEAHAAPRPGGLPSRPAGQD